MKTCAVGELMCCDDMPLREHKGAQHSEQGEALYAYSAEFATHPELMLRENKTLSPAD